MAKAPRLPGGYFIIHRKLLDNDIGSDPMRFYIFCHLLARANFAQTTIQWNGEPRNCPRGGLVCSTRGIAKEIGLNKKTVMTHLAYLQKRHTLKVETAHEGTMVTFLNYEKYQSLTEIIKDLKKEVVQQTDHKLDQVLDQVLDHTVSPHKELKKEKVGMRRPEKSQSPLLRPKSAAHLTQILGEDFCLRISELYPDSTFLDVVAKKITVWAETNKTSKTLRTETGWRRTFSSWAQRDWDSWARKGSKESTQRSFSV